MTTSSQPTLPSQTVPRPRRRRAHVWLRLLGLIVIFLFVVDVALTPWAVHIGGRFTPLETWDGYGPVLGSNGGRYILFTHLDATMYDNYGRMMCDFRGCDNLRGSAQLCTETGKTYSFSLTGQVHSWWSTDGARTDIDLAGGQLTGGWVVAFHGVWHGPVLPLADTDNSFTEVFTAAGQIRHVTSTADAGTARAVIRPGSAAAFSHACHRLASTAH